jgi:segregation and condensation protein A
MDHTVTIREFEGPLGILLELVERNKLEVTTISVAEITGQYLERIHALEQHSPEALSEFLELGTRLLYIKSLALLPGTATAEQDEELHQLNLELEEYRRFQTAARQLGARTGRQTWQRQATTRLEPHELPLPDISLMQLSKAFSQTLSRLQPASPKAVIRPHLSLETVLGQLRHQLPEGFELQTVLDRCRDRLEVVVTFLALLELIHEGAARVVQTAPFEPITVEATGV